MAMSGSAVSGFTKVLGIKFGRTATKRRAEARMARAAITRLRNKQAKRSFLKKFRQAQAQALVEGVASGASIDSSGTQGRLAAGRSQFRTAMFEFGKMQDLSRQANRAESAADQSDQMAGTVEAFGDVIGGSF